MKKYLKLRKNRSFRYLRGLTQEEAAKKINTRKSNIANTEFEDFKALHVPINPYAKPLGVSETENFGYAAGALQEPTGTYYVSLQKEKNIFHALRYLPQQSPVHLIRKNNYKISRRHNKIKYAIPKRYRLQLLPKIPVEHFMEYAVGSLKRITAMAKKKENIPLSLHWLTKRKLKTDYLLWIANRSFPSLSIGNGQAVLIKPQPYYFATQVVLYSNAKSAYFLGRILESQRTLVNAEDPRHTILSLTDNGITIIGRVLISYKVF